MRVLAAHAFSSWVAGQIRALQLELKGQHSAIVLAASLFLSLAASLFLSTEKTSNRTRCVLVSLHRENLEQN
jgi:hypothetical protein